MTGQGAAYWMGRALAAEWEAANLRAASRPASTCTCAHPHRWYDQRCACCNRHARVVSFDVPPPTVVPAGQPPTDFDG